MWAMQPNMPILWSANTARQYTKCCQLGKALVNRLLPPPPLLRSLMERSTVPLKLAKTFFKNARWFNTSSSFASCKCLLTQTLQILTFSPNSSYIVKENITNKPYNPNIT